MELDFSSIKASDFAAWWGAIIATLLLGFQVWRYLRTGPRLRVSVSPDMQVFPPVPPTGNKKYISVTVVNRGTAPTTITSFCGYYVKNSLLNFQKSKRKSFVVIDDPSLGNAVPFVLSPGQQWSSLADQEKVIEGLGHGVFYIGVQHNQHNKPIYRKITL